MARRTFPDRSAAMSFMAEMHPMFDRANQATAEAIVDQVIEATGTSVVRYDEGNPGSSHFVRVHTTSGTIWINPTHVYVPNSFSHVEGYEVSEVDGARNYHLPNRSSRSSTESSTNSNFVLCGCGVQFPAGTECPYCGL